MGNDFPRISIIFQNAENRNIFHIFSENSRRVLKVFEHHRYLILSHIQMCFFARVTAPFSHTWTLKFKAQPTNAFITTVKQIFGRPSQLPTTAERAVIKSNRWAQFTQHGRIQAGRSHPTFDWRWRKPYMSVELWILESVCYWKAQ